jgi:hypothetical protein
VSKISGAIHDKVRPQSLNSNTFNQAGVREKGLRLIN